MEEILLNPNIVYLFLVAGLSLALMAILTPGTGILEIFALFALLLAGWGVYNLPINFWALGVLLVGLVPFILAVRKPGRLPFLAIAIVCLVVGSTYIFMGEVWWQPAVNPYLAAIVSVLVGGYFWIVARKTVEIIAVTPSHDLGVLVGSLGEAKSEIHEEGSVQVLGELWTARSNKPISEGAVVRVIGREGFILDVEEVEG